MFPKNGITIIDPHMRKDEIQVIKSLTEYLGFELVNETGIHLFIEVEFANAAHYPVVLVKKITIRD
jgi:hypothetical protein